MDVKNAFNDQYKASKGNDYVLDVTYYSGTTGRVNMSFDFMARILVAGNGGSQAGFTVTPFSQLDRESLVNMRDKLVEMGGKPPELPAEAPTLNKPSRGLNP